MGNFIVNCMYRNVKIFHSPCFTVFRSRVCVCELRINCRRNDHYKNILLLLFYLLFLKYCFKVEFKNV